MDDGAKTGSRNSALERGLSILRIVAADQTPVTLPALASRLELPRQSVHRIVGQLVDAGYLRRVPGAEGLSGDAVTVGSALVRQAVDCLTTSTCLAPVQAVLQDLVDNINETCNVGTLELDGVVYLARVECDWPLRMQLAAGSRVPFHCTAIGKLLVAHLPEKTREALVTAGPLRVFTSSTINDPDAFEEHCVRIRMDGFALNREEYHLGLVGIAVPVRMASGEIFAGLAVHGPLPRLSESRLIETVPTLRSAADRIARAMYDGGQITTGS